MTWSIRPIQNLELLRRQLNAILDEISLSQPGYGAALPDVATQPDGRLFTLTTTGALYQVQDGAWELVAT
jgi:hypothetical protein